MIQSLHQTYYTACIHAADKQNASEQLSLIERSRMHEKCIKQGGHVVPALMQTCDSHADVFSGH